MSGLHQRASFVLGVCEGYDSVEAVSEGGLVCTASDCLPLIVPFLLFLPLFVLLLLFLELSYALHLAVFHPMSGSTTVLASVDICVAYVACASTLAFLERVDLHPVVIIRTCSISC